MKLEFIGVCDYAGMDNSGKLNVLGMFGVFNLRTVPREFRRFYILLVFRASAETLDKSFKLRVRLLDPNGGPTSVDEDAVISPGGVSPHPEGARMNLALEVNGLRFEKYGTYQIVVEVDGARAGKLPVYVDPIAEKTK